MILRCARAGDVFAFNAALPLLRRALKDALPFEVFQQYQDGTAQLWLAFDGDDLKAACVTQTAGDSLHYWLCGGDGCDWRDLGNKIADAARGSFRRLTMEGRPGWTRLLGFERGSDGMMERIL